MMQQEARDIECLKAELDERIRELVGDTTGRSPELRDREEAESARVPSQPETRPAVEVDFAYPPPEEHYPTLEEVERRYIIEVLEARRWRISGPRGAARILGLNPSTLRSRMKKLGISRQMPRNREI